MASSSEELRPMRRSKRTACDECKRKKVKCDSNVVPCPNCVATNKTCTITPLVAPQLGPRKRRIDQLEDRLKYMESLVKEASSFNLAPSTKELSTVRSVESETNDSRPMDRTKIWSAGPRAVQSITMPSAREALKMVEAFVSGCNAVIPLFKSDNLLRLATVNYPPGRHESPCEWAALNVVFATVHRFQAMTSEATGIEETSSWHYMQNALSMVPELTVKPPSILSVQAVLSMAIVLQGTPNSQSASVLVATSVRMIHNLRLHQRNSSDSLSSSDACERNRVFWIAYVLDKDISLRLNQPPLLHDADIDLPLPSDQPEDGLGFLQSEDGQSVLNFFAMWVNMGIIQGQVYWQLYSTRAQKLDKAGRDLAMKHIDNLSRKWNKNIPPYFRSENVYRTLSPSDRFHLIFLHLMHFHGMIMAFRINFDSDYWVKSITNPQPDDDIPPLLACVAAARGSLKLMQLLPRGNYSCTWVLLNQYLAAVVLILAEIIRSPDAPTAREDLSLVQPVIRDLHSLAEHDGAQPSVKVRDLCALLEQRALDALNDTELRRIGLSPRDLLEVDSGTINDVSSNVISIQSTLSDHIFPSPAGDPAGDPMREWLERVEQPDRSALGEEFGNAYNSFGGWGQ